MIWLRALLLVARRIDKDPWSQSGGMELHKAKSSFLHPTRHAPKNGSHNVTSYEPSIVTQAFQQPITADGSGFTFDGKQGSIRNVPPLCCYTHTQTRSFLWPTAPTEFIQWITKHTAREPPSARYEAADLECGIAPGRCMVGVANWGVSVTPLGAKMPCLECEAWPDKELSDPAK